MFSQKSVDAIVNGTLYNYGLQFSLNWAQPYWNYAWTLYISQYVAIAFSAVALGFSFLKKDNGIKQLSKSEENGAKSLAKSEEASQSTIAISCSSCHKVISQPLVIMDFSGRKVKLVSICPYCNAVLGDADEKNDVETVVDTPPQEVIH